MRDVARRPSIEHEHAQPVIAGQGEPADEPRVVIRDVAADDVRRDDLGDLPLEGQPGHGFLDPCGIITRKGLSERGSRKKGRPRRLARPVVRPRRENAAEEEWQSRDDGHDKHSQPPFGVGPQPSVRFQHLSPPLRPFLALSPAFLPSKTTLMRRQPLEHIPAAVGSGDPFFAQSAFSKINSASSKPIPFDRGSAPTRCR